MIETKCDSKWEIRAEWFLIFALGMVFIYLARSILVPLLIASLLAYAFDPLVGSLERKGVRRSLAIWFIFFLIVGVIFLFFFFVIPVVQEQIARAVERFPAYMEYIRDKIFPYVEERFGIHIPTTFKEMSETLLPKLREQAPAAFQPVTLFLLAFFSNTARLLVSVIDLIVIPFAFYYLLKDFDTLKQTVVEYIPPRHREEAFRRLHEIDRSLGGFIRGQFLVISFLAVCYGVGLTLLGVDLAFVIGIVAAIGEIVPFIGFMVGLTLALLIALLQFQDLLHPFYVLLLMGAIQSAQAFVISPLVMGHQVGLHPLVVISAIYIGGDLFGFIGVLFAVPIAAVVVVLIKTLAEHYRNSVLYRGSTTVIEPGGPTDPPL
jgi:predicted PurR-regulated permease PerM